MAEIKYLDQNGVVYLKQKIKADLDGKVSKVDGKGLSTNDYTTAEKTKLAGIEAGAQKNTITGVKGSAETNYRTGNVEITKANIGLSNVEDKSSATIRSEITQSDVTTALGYTPINENKIGVANGIAELGADGKVPAAQLPSYVDDVLEFANKTAFPTTGEEGKIYVAKDTNITYRWSGTQYVEISASLALGETSSTAFAGDKGKVAYDHAQAKGSAFASGLYKITTNGEGHVTAAAAVAKDDITALGVPAQDTTYNKATSTSDGLMAKEDKARIDRLYDGTALYLGESKISSTDEHTLPGADGSRTYQAFKIPNQLSKYVNDSEYQTKTQVSSSINTALADYVKTSEITAISNTEIDVIWNTGVIPEGDNTERE